MTTGQALSLMLTAIGMKQTELARLSGLSAKHVNQICGGHVNLTAECAVKISDGIASHLLSLDTTRKLAEARANQ